MMEQADIILETAHKGIHVRYLRYSHHYRAWMPVTQRITHAMNELGVSDIKDKIKKLRQDWEQEGLKVRTSQNFYEDKRKLFEDKFHPFGKPDTMEDLVREILDEWVLLCYQNTEGRWIPVTPYEFKRWRMEDFYRLYDSDSIKYAKRLEETE